METVTGLTKALVELNLESETAVQIADRFFNYKYFCVALGWGSAVAILVPLTFLTYKIIKPFADKLLEEC
jgi:hypothetical protein